MIYCLSRMERPKVICHMMSSIDGRILTANWGSKYQSLGLNKIYETIHESFDADAWLCGRVTMEKDFTDGAKPIIKPGHHEIERLDFVGDRNADSFAIAIDKDGKLGWEKNEISGDHVIAVLTEKVADGYLAHLQDIGLSYIFAGKEDLDFALALEKLGNLFGIKTIMLEGGGHLNGSMLNAGLVDEISLLLLPLVDGTIGSATSFDIDADHRKLPAQMLSVIETQTMAHGVLHIKYKVDHA